MPSSTYMLFRRAILTEQQAVCTYDNRPRELCPHIIGTNKVGEEVVLAWQFGGEAVAGCRNGAARGLPTCKMPARRTGRDPALVDRALAPEARTALADATTLAYANGVFGVPTFVCNEEVFFGNDRLEMLQWRLGRERARVG
jgi:DSBA-like thioredoxin domain